MNKEKPYIYILVRKDLSKAQQAVQAVHASIELVKDIDLETHPSVIILGVRDEAALEKALAKIDLDFQTFREPDRNHELTAIATGLLFGEERQAIKRFQLIK